MWGYRGRPSRPLLVLFCWLALLGASAATCWAAEPSPTTSQPLSARPSSIESPRLTPLALASLLVEHTTTLVDESTTLVKASDEHLLELKALRTEVEELKRERDSFGISLFSWIEASEKADSSATEVILTTGQALARAVRSRNMWRTAAIVLGTLALSGWGAWAASTYLP